VKSKWLVIIIVVLVIVVGVLAFINREQLAGKRALIENPGILIAHQGAEVATIYLEEIRGLGEEEFDIVLRSSGKPPRDLTLTGVPLKALLQKADASLMESASQVLVRAIDGYSVAYTMEEVLLDDHVFLVYLNSGEPLGTKEDGGSGPLMMVPRQDEFGQRWCKFAVEVVLE
jgi:DMSO/TMAO reductase YedYZ molybdopterin-dependent catalytic subunit